MPTPRKPKVTGHYFEPLFYGPNECHDCGQTRENHGRMTGRVFPRTPAGLTRAMNWLAQFDPQTTVTLMGVSTYTVLREGK